MSIARHHAEWLSLIETSGPFLSLPVLLQTFPQGLPPRQPETMQPLRQAYAEWQEQPKNPARFQAWVRFVLGELLGYGAAVWREGQTLPPGLQAEVAVAGEVLRPDGAVVGPDGHPLAGQAQVLVRKYAPGQDLDAPVAESRWRASPATRMSELLHGAGVALGLITNGEQWLMVYAPRNETSGFTTWQAGLWLEEPITWRAFHALLEVRRLFGVAENERLAALFRASAQNQQEVTEQLGGQVRRAVEVLVQAFDRLDQDHGRRLLAGVSPPTLYEAALTVMMRLVFLFSAEERGLLRLGEPLYDANYALSTLREQLRESADRHGEEVLERHADAWARLLATFRAVHGGVTHEAMRLPAYGGTLFDPDRFAFLEGRAAGTRWRDAPAQPLRINNRVVLHLLESLQVLRVKVPGGGPAEARRLSFRGLDIEQIGHVYEGLLDHTAVRATGPVLGLQGARNQEPELPLARLEEWQAQGEAALLEHVKVETGRSEPALRRALREPDLADAPKLLLACGQDPALRARVRPFAALIREDSFGMPVVILPGSVYVTAGATRRSTGTHYTPRSLTEPIVQHTLEPLVYGGPAEGKPEAEWRLKTPGELLALKVCDLAMGSGAFLVQACRYLADRLTEAWDATEAAQPGRFLVTPEGELSQGDAAERLLPQDPKERLAVARRIVADRCLFGVDINPMAVEMAKLSLWLVTLQQNRPFTFQDHALKCGDSLLGLSTMAQLENFSLRLNWTQAAFSTLNLWRHVEAARDKRRQLEALPSDTPAQIAVKQALHEEAETALAKLKAMADGVIGLELRGLNEREYPGERDVLADRLMGLWANGTLTPLQQVAREDLGNRRPLHWPLEFPEVMERGGFDAFVGNPPFVGGKKITGALGTDYRDYLVNLLAGGQRGNADLCAYFFLRVGRLLKDGGMVGLLATNTIAQGDTREIGLDQLAGQGFSIPCAVPSAPWPGEASLEVAHVWLRRGEYARVFVLNGQPVAGITPFLTVPGVVAGNPYRLAANADKSFQGSIVLGLGFVLTPDEAHALIARNPRNRNCLFPYLNGEHLNSRFDQSPSRWVINFHDWPLNREADGIWQTADVKKRKEWLRAGSVPADYPDQVAKDYSDVLEIIIERVKPDRDKLGLKDDSSAKGYAKYWWRYRRMAIDLYCSISGKEKVLSSCRVTKYIVHSLVLVGYVYDAALNVITKNLDVLFGICDSSIYDL